MDVLFHRLQPMPPAHPAAWFPTLPVLGRMGRADDAPMPRSRFLAPDTLYTASGKTATYLALKDAGVGPWHSVIVPAYHCPTMVHPIIGLGARPVLAPVAPDLTVSLEAIRGACDDTVRAVILPHFFGLVQPEIAAIKAWCTEHSIALVEDCAHTFFGPAAGLLPGETGHYAIASTRKFFPGSEGGALVVNGRILSLELPSASLVDEARGIYRMIGDSLRYGAIPGLGHPVAAAAPMAGGPATDEEAIQEASPSPARAMEIVEASAARRALRSVVFLVRHSDHARIAAVRRNRFLRWQHALADVPGVEQFINVLPSCSVPYVYPLRLLRPEAQFNALKYAGVALWRWDQLAVSSDPVSRQLALELVQLPCQHSLGDADFERLVKEFCAVLRSNP